MDNLRQSERCTVSGLKPAGSGSAGLYPAAGSRKHPAAMQKKLRRGCMPAMCNVGNAARRGDTRIEYEYDSS
eukprot:scaffold227191_cov38-Prasinocladus_malaysianus.AAC.1